MADYIERETVLNALSVFNDCVHGNEHFLNGIETAKEIVDKTLSADVMTRDEGIRLGAELAAMHGSDATSQDLEKAYWRGFEDAMQKRDVAPVVHGKWSEELVCGGMNEIWDYTCGVCGGVVHNPYDHMNYCPHCGAKMDLLN